MTSEERAKEIMTWIRSACLDTICTHLDSPSCGCMAFISSAITQAENDKLEEAACAAEKALGGLAHTYSSENAEIYRAQDHALATAAIAIRSLKTDDKREAINELFRSAEPFVNQMPLAHALKKD